MIVTGWLLDADPSIRWQVMRDLTGAPAHVVAGERAHVATEGWGARLLTLQAPDCSWGGSAWSQDWTDTLHTLELLRRLGLDPASEQVQRAIDRVRGGVTWGLGHPWQEAWSANPFFAGEVEPCINGNVVATGAYFGVDVAPLVERLLGEQLADGGWNCDVERGSTVSSMETTLNVLEGLREHERAIDGSAAVAAGRARGEAYLLERRLFRRKSTGEVINPAWLRSSFPHWYHYDVLRALDYLRDAGVTPDERVTEALAVVVGQRDADGRWPLQNVLPGEAHLTMEAGEVTPGRWNTLRAMRVLCWTRAAE